MVDDHDDGDDGVMVRSAELGRRSDHLPCSRWRSLARGLNSNEPKLISSCWLITSLRQGPAGPPSGIRPEQDK